MVSSIIINKEQTNQLKTTADLFRSAEQRINFVYMMLMIGFEVSVLIYILINEFDVTRFFFGIRAGIVLMAGIIVNVIFRKKFFPWIKYLNSFVIITAIYYLAGFSELITPLLILIPFINSFYLK